MTADLLEARDLALQLHRLLSDIDPARWEDGMAGRLRPRLAELQRRMEERRGRFAALAATLKHEIEALDVPGTELRQRWLAFKQHVLPGYMELARGLRAEHIHVPSLRPTNYKRNLFHVGSAAVGLVSIQLMPMWMVLAFAVAWAVFGWGSEIANRTSKRLRAALFRVFGPLAHPHEHHRVNSATWYATALLLLALTQSKLLCTVGVAVLGFGDPAAAVLGRRFGRVQLMHGRTLEGTLAFVASASAAAFTALALGYPFGTGAALLVALAGSAAGAVAELVSLRVDDNFTVPLSAACGAWGAALALGLPL
jgi:dolichol kinase